MRVLKKTIAVLMLLLTVDLLISCCDCREPIFGNYSNCSFTIANLIIGRTTTELSPQITQSKSIPKHAYGIRISVQRSKNICIKSNNSLFTQSAYACSCDFDEFIPRDSIVAVVIKSENDFDEEHLSGSDISDLFFVNERNGFIILSEYVESIEPTEYGNVKPTFEFDIQLLSPPTISTEHQFEVIIELSDGRFLNAHTGLIELY